MEWKLKVDNEVNLDLERKLIQAMNLQPQKTGRREGQQAHSLSSLWGCCHSDQGTGLRLGVQSRCFSDPGPLSQVYLGSSPSPLPSMHQTALRNQASSCFYLSELSPGTWSPRGPDEGVCQAAPHLSFRHIYECTIPIQLPPRLRFSFLQPCSICLGCIYLKNFLKVLGISNKYHKQCKTSFFSKSKCIC